MKNKQIMASFLLGILGWVSFMVHGAIKNHLINQLGSGPPHTLSTFQSYGIFFSMSITMVACAAFGFWLLLKSKQESNTILRALAWPLHISYSFTLVLVWLVSGAEP